MKRNILDSPTNLVGNPLEVCRETVRYRDSHEFRKFVGMPF
jgi:hypothetical protein